MTTRRLVFLCLLASVVPGANLQAQVKMTTKQALALAFPKCKINRQTHLLTTAQRKQIATEAGQKFSRTTVFAYVARRNGKVVGTGWFDAHRVRSKKQLLMVTVTPEQTVGRVEVLAFQEPARYRAPRPWLARFAGKRADRVQLGRGIQRITGATLTVQASTRCVARVLAIHRAVFGTAPKVTTKKPTSKPAKRAEKVAGKKGASRGRAPGPSHTASAHAP